MLPLVRGPPDGDATVSPAEEAGIRVGDCLVAINDVMVAFMAYPEMVNVLSSAVRPATLSFARHYRPPMGPSSRPEHVIVKRVGVGVGGACVLGVCVCGGGVMGGCSAGDLCVVRSGLVRVAEGFTLTPSRAPPSHTQTHTTTTTTTTTPHPRMNDTPVVFFVCIGCRCVGVGGVSLDHESHVLGTTTPLVAPCIQITTPPQCPPSPPPPLAGRHVEEGQAFFQCPGARPGV
jgi:hypothetical protein